MKKNDWQPIETAPKDGTAVLVCGIYDEWNGPQPGILTARWYEWKEFETWRWLEGADREDDNHVLFEPTHWMPLPAPPETEDAQCDGSEESK